MENEDTVGAAVDQKTVGQSVADDAVVEEELLIEEISIDGMCGVY
jgi:mycofactocin precursor